MLINTEDTKKESRLYSGLALVAPAGIEPASSESESEILSIEIRSQEESPAKVIKGSEVKKHCRRKNHLPLIKK
jgi:hypothetical protein